MKSKEYWRKRFEQLENAAHNYSIEAYQKIEPVFTEALKDIEYEITKWYNRFSFNNMVSIADAKRMLNAAELKELRWDVKEYIKHGKENYNDIWTKELENASARFHINRLEALKIRTQQAMELAFGNELDVIDDMVRKVYSESYYHSIFELQKGVGIGTSVGHIDNRKLERIISKPWAPDGKNFSERIWNSKSRLINEVHSELTRNCILGKGPDEAIKNISHKFQVTKAQAGRLVQTEQAFFHATAQKDAFNELDVEQFEIVATLDSHTSAICREMDGKHFTMDEYEPGVTAPPFHPWCRSVTAPYFDDEWGRSGERAAKDKDGKTYYVPADMTYEEWGKRFYGGGDKLDFDIIYDNQGIIHYKNKSKPISVKDRIIKIDEILNDKRKEINQLTKAFKEKEVEFLNTSDPNAFSEAANLKNKLNELDVELKDLNLELDDLLNNYEFNLKNAIINLNRYEEIGQDELNQFKKSAGKATATEKKKIYTNPDGGYIKTPNSWNINKYLRDGDKGVLEYGDKDLKTIEILESVILKNECTKDLILHRYVSRNFLDQFGIPQYNISNDNIINRLNILNAGEEVEFKGFTSTSYDISKNVFHNKPIQLVLHVPKGTNCYLTTNKIESEVILNKGCKFKIYGSEYKNEKIVMYLELVK